MKLNTIIKLSGGRVGTICYHYLDGYGGVWGRQRFVMPPCGFGDLPEPQFMLRDIKMQHRFEAECVGEMFEIIEENKEMI